MKEPGSQTLQSPAMRLGDLQRAYCYLAGALIALGLKLYLLPLAKMADASAL